jgi:hypothetical protein
VADTEKRSVSKSFSSRRAMVDLPAPLGATRMMILPLVLPLLLNILYLFANLFEFLFGINNQVRNFRIIGFGPDGIQLPVDLLA